MVTKDFYLVGYDPATARAVEVNPADVELKALRAALAAEFHIVEPKGTYQGDLDHSGREPILTRAQGSPSSPTRPAPSIRSTRSSTPEVPSASPSTGRP